MGALAERRAQSLCESDNVQVFPVKTDIVVRGSNLGGRVRTITVYLLTYRPKGVSSRQLERDLGNLLPDRLAPVASHPGGLPHEP